QGEPSLPGGAARRRGGAGGGGGRPGGALAPGGGPMSAGTLPRLLFMGTPDFAVPSLRALVAAGFPVDAVITQPDRPRGRGHRLTPSPVKAAALELALPVWQPER